MPIVCPSPTRAEALRALVNSAEPSELPDLAAELGRSLVGVLMRSTANAATAAAPEPGKPADELLTVGQAAARLGVARTWLYRNAKALPFTRKLGHRTLRFDARALERWATTRRAI